MSGSNQKAFKYLKIRTISAAALNPAVAGIAAMSSVKAGLDVFVVVFGFVRRNLSEAQRRKDAASGVRGAGKGRQPLSPPQPTVALEREQHSGLMTDFRMPDGPEVL